MQRRKLLAGSLAATAVAMVGAGWAVRHRNATEASADWRRIERTSTLRVGYAVEAPYAYVAPDLRITGESPEMARWVASALGLVRIEWVQVHFSSLIPDLLGQRFDTIASGLFVNESRARLVAFSHPTLRVRSGLLLRADRMDQRGETRDWVLNSSRPMAALTGSVEVERLLAWGVPRDRLTLVPDARTGYLAVLQGRADGLALSWPTTRWMAVQRSSVPLIAVPVQLGPTPAGRPVTPVSLPDMDDAAFAFRPQSTELLQRWNAALEPLLGTPAHLSVVAPFGFSAAELGRPPAALGRVGLSGAGT
jgi:polar amino acid transport system substrate-binding protein